MGPFRGRVALGLGILAPFKSLHHFFLFHKNGVGGGIVLALLVNADAVGVERTLAPNIQLNLRAQQNDVSINIPETLQNE